MYFNNGNGTYSDYCSPLTAAWLVEVLRRFSKESFFGSLEIVGFDDKSGQIKNVYVRGSVQKKVHRSFHGR